MTLKKYPKLISHLLNQLKINFAFITNQQKKISTKMPHFPNNVVTDKSYTHTHTHTYTHTVLSYQRDQIPIQLVTCPKQSMSSLGWDFFLAVVVSVLLYQCTTSPLMKCIEKRLEVHKNSTSCFKQILNATINKTPTV